MAISLEGLIPEGRPSGRYHSFKRTVQKTSVRSLYDKTKDTHLMMLAAPGVPNGKPPDTGLIERCELGLQGHLPKYINYLSQPADLCRPIRDPSLVQSHRLSKAFP